MKMRSYNFCHTNTKNPGNNLGIFCLITGRPKLNGYVYYPNGIILVLRIFSYYFKVISADYYYLLLLAPNLFGVMENVALPNYK